MPKNKHKFCGQPLLQQIKIVVLKKQIYIEQNTEIKMIKAHTNGSKLN